MTPDQTLELTQLTGFDPCVSGDLPGRPASRSVPLTLPPQPIVGGQTVACGGESQNKPGDDQAIGEYRQWRMLSAGTDGMAYLADHAASGRKVELRLIRPVIAKPKDNVTFRERLRLLTRIQSQSLRRIVGHSLDIEAPWVAIEDPLLIASGDRLWCDFIAAARRTANAHAVDPPRIALCLIELLDQCHRVGLTAGLEARSVVVSADNRIRVDLSGLRVCEGDGSPRSQSPPTSRLPFGKQGSGTGDQMSSDFAARFAGGPEEDLTQLQRLLGDLLYPWLSSADAQSAPARWRAALRSMLQASGGPGAMPPGLSQWNELLSLGEAAASFPGQTGQIAAGQTAGPTPDPIDPPTLGATPAVGTTIGRYRLDAKLGQGAMGVVYRGTDMASEATVAVKVLRIASRGASQATRRFHKEARLLAGIQNDHVTRLYESGEDQGHPYIAMEYIEGESLQQWLAKSGPLNETSALEVVADIARGLVDAHARGIIHRDIKPENVLLQRVTEENRSLSPTLQPSFATLSHCRVKLSDFGIARQIDQSDSLAVTQAGAILGTPIYMSPEQCRGTTEIGPQTDVYSLGITLFELLTGRPPFLADEPLNLAAKHCFDPPPDIRAERPEISQDTAALVARALAKLPADRFADATQFLSHVQRLLRGEPSAIDAHPKLPEHSPARLWQKTFRWQLESTPAQLWPLVSNTERLNRAIGLPPVTYRTVDDPVLGLRKFGSFRLSGMRISWEEHPFEWIETKRMGILREFDSGPLRWFMSIVEFIPGRAGGTELRHTLKIEPRNLIGRAITSLEAGFRSRRNLDRVYRRIDRSIQAQNPSDDGQDPFEPSPTVTAGQRMRIEQRGRHLFDHGIDPDVASRLTDHLTTAPSQSLNQIRPLALATALGTDGEGSTDACLLAAAHGLLSLRWDVLCPTCRASAATFDSLRSIASHTHCAACQIDFRSDIGGAIELVFRAHPEIRDVDDGIYCIGGPEHSPHVVAQVRLQPGERMELELSLPEGDYQLRGRGIRRRQPFRVLGAAAPRTAEWLLARLGETNHVAALQAGSQTIAITNDQSHLEVIRVERMVPRGDCVTATQASTLPLFRQLFPDQIVNGDAPIAADQMTLVATAITEVERLYGEWGDREAYRRIQRHFDVLGRSVARHHGTVAKTIGDGVLAAFVDGRDAVAAVLAMQGDIQQTQRLEGLTLSIGVHRGRTLMATVNQKLDYFGTTARVVEAMPAHAQGGILLTDAVFSDPQVQKLLSDHAGLTPDKLAIEYVDLPGRPRQLVQRVEHESS